MSLVMYNNLNEALVRAQLPHVTDTQAAWIFLQEPGFVGFGVVQKEAMHWPPGIQPDWSRITDLRLFGEKGEWHAWSHWNRHWQSRLLQLQELKDCLTEYHVLWGTKVRAVDGVWVPLTEDRGVELWLAVTVEEVDLPLRLKLAQIMEYDLKNGLVGVVDAALIALVSASDVAKIFIPPSKF